MFRTTHWVLTLALAAGLGTFLAYNLSTGHGAEGGSYLGYFMVVNALVGRALVPAVLGAAQALEHLRPHHAVRRPFLEGNEE
jgi:hypothetical protein